MIIPKEDRMFAEVNCISEAFEQAIEYASSNRRIHGRIASAFRKHIYGGAIPKATPPSFESSEMFWNDVLPLLGMPEEDSDLIRKSYSDVKLHDSCIRAFVGTVAGRCPGSPLVSVRDELFFGRYKNPN